LQNRTSLIGVKFTRSNEQEHNNTTKTLNSFSETTFVVTMTNDIVEEKSRDLTLDRDFSINKERRKGPSVASVDLVDEYLKACSQEMNYANFEAHSAIWVETIPKAQNCEKHPTINGGRRRESFS
jgi:hypothetical protein